MPLGPKMPPNPNIKLTFSEYGHVAYQIKGNAAYNNILANILLLHLPVTRTGERFRATIALLFCIFFLHHSIAAQKMQKTML